MASMRCRPFARARVAWHVGGVQWLPTPFPLSHIMWARHVAGTAAAVACISNTVRAARAGMARETAPSWAASVAVTSERSPDIVRPSEAPCHHISDELYMYMYIYM